MSAPSPFQTAHAIGTNISGAFREARDDTSIQRILSEATQSGNPDDVQNAIGKILSQVSPERQPAAINYLQNQFAIVEQKRIQKNKQEAYAKQGLDPNLSESINTEIYKNKLKESSDERKNQANISANYPQGFHNWAPAAQTAYINAQNPKPAKPTPLSPGERFIQVESAKDYLKDKKQIPIIRDSLENLNEVRKLTHELSGPTGYIKAAVGSESATKLEAMGLAALDNIIKIFNPSGNLATQKLNFIREKFSFTPWDRTPKILGKIDALEKFGKQALKRAEDRVNLYEKYNGNPPQEVVNKFDQETETLADALVEYGKDMDSTNDSDDRNKSKSIGRRKVPQGTPLTETTIYMYYQMAGNDPVEATRLAKEDGYDVPE